VLLRSGSLEEVDTRDEEEEEEDKEDDEEGGVNIMTGSLVRLLAKKMPFFFVFALKLVFGRNILCGWDWSLP
jgi:hypothetical protein